MLNFLKKRITKTVFRNWIKRRYDLYDISDLEVGGHCGCCGAWMAKEIVPKWWSWSLCEKCCECCELGEENIIL